MSSAAWSALADRFADPTVPYQFAVWGPPVVLDVAVPNARRSAGEMILASRSPAVEVWGPPRPEEFARFNCFWWLAWAAGRLADPTAARPDLAWLRALVPAQSGRWPGSGDRGADAGPASAALARRYASSPPPIAPPAGVPHGLLTVRQGCDDSKLAGATYPSAECRRTRL